MGEDSTASSGSGSDSDSNSNSDSASDDSSNDSSSSSSTTTTEECRDVHLDKAWCPGTKKLRTIVREVAEENDCPKFSKKLSKEIVKQMEIEMEGMRFFRTIKNDTDDDDSSDSDDDDDSNDSDKSDKSDDESSKGEYGFGCFTEDDEIDVDDEDDVEEIPPEDLYDALKPFYLGERFMIQEEAHCRDVYFKHPNHPGTEAFVRASQKVVLRQGVAKSYDEKTYKKMVRLLYDSKFFVGKAPECIEADEDECDRIFRARYEFDRKMMRKVLADNMESRPIPGTVCIKCSCCSKKDPNKDNCVIKLLLCVPKAMGIPVLAILGFFAFGFLYFFVYFVFKTLITAVYVATGVSLSFFFGDSGGDGGGDEEDTAVAEDVERYLRSRW